MKTKEEKAKELQKIISDANQAKDRLYEVHNKLLDAGFTRKAKSCMSLIYAIEEWQNRS